MKMNSLRWAGGILAALIGLSAPAFAEDEVTKMAQDANQWPSAGRDNALTRHSPLKDINTENVSKLQMVWSQSTGALRGHEGQPVVISDVGGKPMMFFVSGCPEMSKCNIVQGLDLSDPDHPKQIWNYVKQTDRDETAVPRACCDTVNRGPVYADGKVVFGTLDGFVVALDAQTGKEVWVVKHAWPEKGETITNAPLIADGLVIIGFGGDEFAARGRVNAYDLKTGKQVWKCYSTGSDKDVCLTADTNKANPQYGTAGKDLGIHTHVGNDWKIGGGSAWGWFSYDPELKMVYYSTGNPGLWSPSYRCSKKTHEECNSGEFDNKWSMTIFGRKVDTGEAVFAYQMTPFDQWDYDGVNENILVNMNVDGKDRKTLVHFDRNGFSYVLDRTDGTLLRANKYVTANWAEKIDLATGRPVKVREHSPLERGRNVNACPSAESISGIVHSLPQTEREAISRRTDEILSIATRMKAMNRALLKRLHPVSVGKVPLSALIEDLVGEFQRTHPEVRIRYAKKTAVLAYGERIDLTVYRSAQEALTNALRHGRASQILVELREDEGFGETAQITLRVSDNGTGIKPDRPVGFGLSAMRERVLASGGCLAIADHKPHGTTISIKIPLLAADITAQSPDTFKRASI